MPLSFRTSRARSTNGHTMAEFAMIAPLFFLLIFGVLDFAWLMFAQSNIQQAVDDGGRYASTGQESGGTGTRISSIISKVQSEISVPSVNANNLTICSVPPGGGSSLCWNSGVDSGNTGAAGGPEYTTTITLTTTLPLMTPLIGKFFPAAGYTFTSSSTFTNEPFNPSSTD
jgi:Flp pilus assembly protein TadG